MGRKILASVDLGDCSLVVLNAARSIAGEEDELVLLHVVSDPSRYAGFHVPHQSTDRTRGELVEEARNEMERFVDRYAAGTPYLLKFGVPSKEIVKAAAEAKADVLVIGSHESGGKLEQMFSPRTTKKILRKATCEVEVINLPLENEEELQSKPKI
jgi:nucleotide-binding universal stress UspA family protein